MNWGTKIVLGMIAFMLFIVAMVVYMFKVHGNDAIVDEDYYEKGINYNQEYNATQNMLVDNATPTVNITKSQIILKLKDSASYEIKLMRPSTVKDNIQLKGSTLSTSNLILIDRTTMHFGVWFLELRWTSKGKDYLYKTTLRL